MVFRHEYIVQFRDTDAAGVVYFASTISICHIAYEASLMASGIDLKLFVNNADFAVPITHVSADFFKPLYCGDRLIIALTPRSIDHCRFEVEYQILATNSQPTDRAFVTATTKHVVIDPSIRARKNLPDILINWLSDWGE
jgi:1,4-dihydroxy-2-naphthoyl-CoA hydrolase